jgi:ferrous iron transport protein B
MIGKKKTAAILAAAAAGFGILGNAVKIIFAPLGFDSAQAVIATIMGLIAKEEVVAVFGILDFAGMSALAAFSFMVFNLLCAPCFAAMGAIKREMNSTKWFLFAIGYQTLFAYVISLIIYQSTFVTQQLTFSQCIIYLITS